MRVAVPERLISSDAACTVDPRVTMYVDCCYQPCVVVDDVLAIEVFCSQTFFCPLVKIVDHI
eukprot:m.365062 g.365062  ORF g.365062 m.365062 type:complete len:62 (+) comp29818_c0_seq1:181-366(+)